RGDEQVIAGGAIIHSEPAGDGVKAGEARLAVDIERQGAAGDAGSGQVVGTVAHRDILRCGQPGSQRFHAQVAGHGQRAGWRELDLASAQRTGLQYEVADGLGDVRVELQNAVVGDLNIRADKLRVGELVVLRDF